MKNETNSKNEKITEEMFERYLSSDPYKALEVLRREDFYSALHFFETAKALHWPLDNVIDWVAAKGIIKAAAL